MTRTMRPEDLIDSNVVDPDGGRIGKVGTVYLADDTRTPEWVTVKTGLFGHKESFVPLSGADIDEIGLHVNVGKDQVAEAPRMEKDGNLSQSDSTELYRHYGLPMPRSALDQQTARPRADKTMRDDKALRGDKTLRDNAGRASADGRPAAGKQAAARQGGDQARTRPGEQLGTERIESGHVRLHKYIVGEERTTTAGGIGKGQSKDQGAAPGHGKHRKT
jgi:hypothetical protein